MRWSGVLRLGVGIVLGLAFLGLIARMIDLHAVRALAAHAALWPLLFAFIAYAGDFVLRAVRFCWMLRYLAGERVPVRRALSPFIASFGVSDLLPLRAGDGFRIFWFARRFGIGASTMMAVMLVERLLDLASIVALGAVAIWLIGPDVSVVLRTSFEVAALATITALAIVIYAPGVLSKLLAPLFHRGRGAAVQDFLATMGRTTQMVARRGGTRWIAAMFGVSILCWLLEALLFLGAWISLGGVPDAIGAPAMAFVFSTLGTLVPSLPGHFGSFEFFGIQSLTLSGVEVNFASAVILLAHLLLWLPTAVFALIWVALPNRIRPLPSPSGELPA